MGMLKMTLIGNLGADPEMKFLQNGDALMNFSVGVTVSVKKQGQTEKVTHWFRCTMFGKRAQTLQPMLHKGKQVYVEGELNPRLWQDQQGQTKLSLDLRVSDVQLLGSKDDGQQSQGGGGYAPAGGGQQQDRRQQRSAPQNQAPAQGQEEPPDDGPGASDEDLPF